MYCSFYGIQEKPFSITPDPKFLYLGATHKEAFAHLVYGIRERGGFIAITGEIGTGKTTLCRALLAHLDPDTLVAFIFNPTLLAIELLKSINEDFGISSQGGTRKDLIDELNRFLLQKRQEGKNTVLIIDECQNLDLEVLEHIRLLSNLETDTEKLLQIILIGQPEFRTILAQPRLHQLNQRVTVRYHLQPLSREETSAYVRHRLSVVGAEDKIAFTPQALNKIYRYTGGIPRLINVLCDRCLLAGYTLGKREIDVAIVDRANREVSLSLTSGRAHPFARFLRRGLLPGALLAAFLLLVGYGVHLFTSGTALRGSLPLSLEPGLELGAAVEDLAVTPEPTVISDPPPAADAASFPPDGEEEGKADAMVAPVLQEALESAGTGGTPAASGSVALPAEAPGPEADGQLEESWIRSLREKDVLASRREALAAILARWNLLPDSVSAGQKVLALDIYEAARTVGLHCARFQGNLSRIRALNVPMILEIRVGGSPGRRFLALLGLAESTARIAPALEDGSDQIPAGLLEKHWFGNAYVFWKDEVSGEMYLMEGMEGHSVAWLQACLKRLGYLDAKPTGVFDLATAHALRAFQAEHDLEEDGILGPQTRILLIQSLKDANMPALSGTS
ncbi:MAG: AAA family ATPase [bacterium]